jgi:uncharacterized surface protein with fasciclin (FAS1) repeats
MKRILLPGLAALALVPASAAAAPAAATTTAPTANIVGTAKAAGDFTTLLALAKRAGLVGALSGPGKLTVFAPTDAAFAKVPKATLAKLQADKALLKRVLLYHVVQGEVAAKRVVKLKSARTLAGPSVRIRVTGTTVRVDTARVTAVDVRATNGIIHVVDRVLIPPA